MAFLKGKGAMTGVNLIAKVYNNSATKDNKSHYIDVQVDARDTRGPEQTNLHLRSDRVMGDDGKTRYNNGAPYSVGQLQEIVKAAGPNTEPILDKDNKAVGTLYGNRDRGFPHRRRHGSRRLGLPAHEWHSDLCSRRNEQDHLGGDSRGYRS